MSFQPTFGICETARNVKTFCKENKAHFRKLLIPLLPSLVISGMIPYTPFSEMLRNVLTVLILLFQTYLYTILAVQWHRFTILGPDSDQEIKIFEKKMGVWHYLGFVLIIFLIFLAIMLPSILITYVFHTAISTPILIIGIFSFWLIATYITSRIGIVLPSIAVGNYLTIKDAFALSKGIVSKIIFASMVATAKPLLLTLANLLLYFIIVGIFAANNPEFEKTVDTNIGFSILTNIVFLPMLVYLQPWMTILGVTSLSNYYLWATQNAEKQPAAQTDTLPPV